MDYIYKILEILSIFFFERDAIIVANMNKYNQLKEWWIKKEKWDEFLKELNKINKTILSEIKLITKQNINDASDIDQVKQFNKYNI